MRIFLAVISVAALLSANGVSAKSGGQGTPEPTAPPVSAWPKPLILPIKLPPTGASKEWTQVSIVAGKGLVGGSEEAVSSIGQPLGGVNGRSRVLDVCKKTLWDQASRAGAESIEAVSEAPDQRTKSGRVFAPVTMRLSYANRDMIEVRKSTAICVADRAGRFVDLYIPAASDGAASRGRNAKGPATQWSRLRIAVPRSTR